MIQNTEITKKLNEKTQDDPILREFIENLLENEIQGKNYTKFYESKINDALKKEGLM